MADIDTILKDEVQNRSNIILREYHGGWRAYEQSAYHFACIFKMGKIEIRDNNLFLEVNKELEFLHSKAMRTVRISSVADAEIHIECNKVFDGFSDWRSKIIKVLSE